MIAIFYNWRFTIMYTSLIPWVLSKSAKAANEGASVASSRETGSQAEVTCKSW